MTKSRKRKEREEKKSSPDTAGESTLGDEVLRQRIAEKAYELYQQRGELHGRDLDDWLEAERLVLSEIGPQGHRKTKKPRRQGSAVEIKKRRKKQQ